MTNELSYQCRDICVEHFYRTFPQLELLTMWRMQFIDESHFLIKFACPDCVIGRVSINMRHCSQIGLYTSTLIMYSIQRPLVILAYLQSIITRQQRWQPYMITRPKNFQTSSRTIVTIYVTWHSINPFIMMQTAQTTFMLENIGININIV